MAKHDIDPMLQQVSGGLWRLSLESIDGWTLRASAGAEDERGPFARLLGSSP
jgi:hypothetical protein